MADNHSFEIKIDETSKEACIIFSEICTLKELKDTSTIVKSLFECNAISVDLTKVEEMDVSGLQFLHFITEGKKWESISLQPIVSKKLGGLLIKSGFNQFVKNDIE